MKILVTGATGFVGGAAAHRLLALDHEVTTTGRNAIKGTRLRAQGLAFQPADLADPAAVDALVAGQDLVVHSAALTSPWGDRDAFQAANVTAVQHIVDACARHGVTRLVHISSPSVHATLTHRRDVPEDAPWGPPLNDYIRTKREAEQIVRGSGVPHVILRPRAVFGPGDNAVLPRLVNALERGRLPLIDGGRHEVDLTYIDNLTQAIELACFTPDVDGGVYHVANGEPRPIVELIRMLCDRLDLPFPRRNLSWRTAFTLASVVETVHRVLPLGEPVLTRYGATVVGRGTTLDLSAARRDLGFDPEVSLEEGVDRFVTWWKETTG